MRTTLNVIFTFCCALRGIQQLRRRFIHKPRQDTTFGARRRPAGDLRWRDRRVRRAPLRPYPPKRRNMTCRAAFSVGKVSVTRSTGGGNVRADSK